MKKKMASNKSLIDILKLNPGAYGLASDITTSQADDILECYIETEKDSVTLPYVLDELALIINSANNDFKELFLSKISAKQIDPNNNLVLAIVKLLENRYALTNDNSFQSSQPSANIQTILSGGKTRIRSLFQLIIRDDLTLLVTRTITEQGIDELKSLIADIENDGDGYLPEEINVAREYTKLSKQKTLYGNENPIIDDNAFIQLIADPNSKIPYEEGDLKETSIIRLFLCAKCVYLTHLMEKYMKLQKDVMKKMAQEKLRKQSENLSFQQNNIEIDRNASPLMRSLIKKKALIQRMINLINEKYADLVASDSEASTPDALLSKMNAGINFDPDEDAVSASISWGDKQVNYKTTENDEGLIISSYNNFGNYYRFLVAGENFKNLLKFESDIENDARYNIAMGAKRMIDAGVDPEVRYKFYRMAFAFALAPFTMFDTMSLNIVLMGPPGTGKSTLAKKMSAFAYAIGWLVTNDVYEPKPSDIISNQRGQTALQTRDFLNASLGGMCFIDEAYALTPPGDLSGKEFADELTEFLTNHKGMLMVLVAGYVNEMTNDFLQANIGLPRRFPTRIVLGEKTPYACFSAFMYHLSKMMQKNNAVT